MNPDNLEKAFKKSNHRKCKNKLKLQEALFNEGLIEFNTIYNSFIGWKGYTQQANTYNLTSKFSKHFQKVYENELFIP